MMFGIKKMISLLTFLVLNFTAICQEANAETDKECIIDQDKPSANNIQEEQHDKSSEKEIIQEKTHSEETVLPPPLAMGSLNSQMKIITVRDNHLNS